MPKLTSSPHPLRGRLFILAILMSSLALTAARADEPAGTVQDDFQPRRLADLVTHSGIQGGLVVHLHCGKGQQTATLRLNGRYLVHGIDTDAQAIAQARMDLMDSGDYGPVSFDTFDGRHLPYADNLVNLLIAETPGQVPIAEVRRVLCPGGVAFIYHNDRWTRTVKPRPAEIDDWTHYLHDPTNNAVAQDQQVGPPRRVQWIGRPLWARSHEHLASLSALVSAAGRLFYIIDHGPVASVRLPSDWQLVARDAYNGLLLWKRPIEVWEDQLRPFRSGPAQLPRRLVSVGDRVYVTLGYGQPVSALDAATGKVVRTYEHTEQTREILCTGNVLYLVVGGGAPQWPNNRQRRGRQDQAELDQPQRPRILAVDASTGRHLWQKDDQDSLTLLPLSLAVDARTGRLFFQNTRHLVCLEATSGKVLWRADRPSARQRMASNGPTVVVYGDVVLSADRSAPPAPEDDNPTIQWTVSLSGGGRAADVMAFDVHTGRLLWTSKTWQGYKSPPDLFVIDGKVWTGNLLNASSSQGITEALDVHTGQVVQRRPADQTFYSAGMPHHRCYRNKATRRFLLIGRAGVEFVDTTTGQAVAHHWVRGTCQYGIMPANGLLYAPPHSCACFIRAKLNSFNALSAQPAPDLSGSQPLLETGPAYRDIPQPDRSDRDGDWPTYRHDPARSGSTTRPLADRLNRLWEADLPPGRLSSITVADGRLYVAAIDRHTVHALDADTGRHLWRFTAGGPVDSPPTCWAGRVLFGSADGWVYCLRATDGVLAWRLRAAPAERRIMAYNQLESSWPVHGSVLVEQGQVYFVAGRSSYLDGGMVWYRLDGRTGKVLARAILDSRDPKTGQVPRVAVNRFELEGLLPDVLSSDGRFIYLRHAAFDPDGQAIDQVPAHLFTPTGFLDGSWWHRTYLLYASKFNAGWSGWFRAGNRYPAGRLLVHDHKNLYGFGRNMMPPGNAGQWNKGEYYQLFAAEMAQASAEKPTDTARRRGNQKGPAGESKKLLWEKPADLAVRAMVLAGKRLALAGPLGDTTRSLEAYQGKTGLVLRLLDTADGRTVTETALQAMPVWDGMAAANGRLYLACTDGRVLCFGP